MGVAEDEFDDVFGAEEVEENLEAEETEEQEEQEEAEEVAKTDPSLPKGYMTKEAWIEAGKNPEDWVSPEVFVETRKRIEETNRLRRELRAKEEEFNNRIKNLNALQQKQLSRQRQDLLDRRDEAIDTADKAEVKRLDKELKSLDEEAELIAEKEEASPQKPAEVVEWENDNPWCHNPDDPRLAVAQKAWQEAQADVIAGKRTIAGALRLVDKAVAAVDVDDKKPAKRTPTPMVDSSKTTASTRNDGPSISWKDLTRDELAIYDDLYQGMSKKDYLQAVADSRKGA